MITPFLFPVRKICAISAISLICGQICVDLFLTQKQFYSSPYSLAFITSFCPFFLIEPHSIPFLYRMAFYGSLAAIRGDGFEGGALVAE
jgi:hypothetical protein